MTRSFICCAVLLTLAGGCRNTAGLDADAALARISIKAASPELQRGDTVKLVVHNGDSFPIFISPCSPRLERSDVEGDWVEVTIAGRPNCEEVRQLDPGSDLALSLDVIPSSAQPGTYRYTNLAVDIRIDGGASATMSEIATSEPFLVR
jgi:hypothetical protein